jgi:hypothetical protein
VNVIMTEEMPESSQPDEPPKPHPGDGEVVEAESAEGPAPELSEDDQPAPEPQDAQGEESAESPDASSAEAALVKPAPPREHRHVPVIKSTRPPADAAGEAAAKAKTQWDESTDTGAIADVVPEEPREEAEADWDNEMSVKRISIELSRIEKQVRDLLGDQDPKRKRKLAGTRRWLELEDDIRDLLHSGRINNEVIRQLHQLVIRRHRLFRRLHFLTGTRPTWNT